MTTFPPAPGFRSSQRTHRIVIIDGPNMSNLGARNKRVYGAIASLQDLQNLCKGFGASVGVDVTTFSSNFEGAILEFIHESARSTDAYIINPAGLTVGGLATMAALYRDRQAVHRSPLREHRSSAHRAAGRADRPPAFRIQRQRYGRHDGHAPL